MTVSHDTKSKKLDQQEFRKALSRSFDTAFFNYEFIGYCTGSWIFSLSENISVNVNEMVPNGNGKERIVRD